MLETRARGRSLVNSPNCRAAFINGLTYETQSSAERGHRRGIHRRLFYRLAEQHGCAEESLQERVVQFVHDARTLSEAFFPTDIIFGVRLSKRRISAAGGDIIGVNGTYLRTSTSLMN